MSTGPTDSPTRVFLHVGSPKTGTTFLQNVLWAQRERARDQGLLLPLERFNDHYLATLDVRGIADQPHHPQRAVGMWDRVVAEALAWSGTVLVSHELFAAASTEQATSAVAQLEAGGAEVHIVLTARDLSRQLTAEWQEHIKHRSTVGFGDFVASVRRDEERSSWFWRVQDFAGVLDRWGATVPAERVHVVTVPPAGTPPSVLWQRFATLLGLDATSFDIDLPRSNSSLGMEQAELLRRVNLALGERLPLPGPYPAVVQGVLAHQILEPREGTRIALAADDARFAADQSGAIGAELARAGYDVIGDLSELTPETSLAEAPEQAADPAAEALLEESVDTIADLMVRLQGHRVERRRLQDLAEAARAKPIRYALLQASRGRPTLERAHRAYRRVRGRTPPAE